MLDKVSCITMPTETLAIVGTEIGSIHLYDLTEASIYSEVTKEFEQDFLPPTFSTDGLDEGLHSSPIVKIQALMARTQSTVVVLDSLG